MVKCIKTAWLIEWVPNYREKVVRILPQINVHTLFPHIVSSLECFPPLNSFRTLVRKLFKFLLHKRKLNVETISNFQGFTVPKKNSCRLLGTQFCKWQWSFFSLWYLDSALKSVHFKKAVAQSSFLSKVLSFSLKSKQSQRKWQQLWKKWGLCNCLLKMNAL